MKIRIVKASEPTYWYEDAIGKIYTVLSTDEVERKYKVDGGWYVDFEDCEEVIEHEGQLYRKVDREVIIGDTVLITDANMSFGKYQNGDVLLVDGLSTNGLYIYSNQASYWQGNARGAIGGPEYVVIESIESASSKTYPDAPAYATVSEAIHNALAESESNTSIEFNSDRLLDTLSNLAQEVAELKRNQEELIARMNDLGDGAEVAMVKRFEEVAGKLATLKAEHIQKSIMHVDPELVTYLNTKAEAYDIALLLVKEALRNG